LGTAAETWFAHDIHGPDDMIPQREAIFHHLP
jgi:hypothetical protein